MKIDLHIHSLASDGSFSPVEILDLVQKTGLGAFSITDHDTVAGNVDVLEIGIPESVKFLSGVEISSYPPEPFTSSGSFHILGYGFDIDNQPLNKSLEKFQLARETRNPEIIKKLNDAGLDISMDEVIQESGGGLVGRPHIANVMVRRGYVPSIKDAFNKYLAKGKPAFVDKYRIDCENAIRLIKDAGGIPVLAHPITLGVGFLEMEELLETMVGLGLLGLEAHYSTHSPEETEKYCQLASKLGLLITGGSDFHGSLKDNIDIGKGEGSLEVPYYLYEILINKLNQ